MRFESAMSAMACNENHVSQFAAAMGWDTDRAESTLAAYGTGKYFPLSTELKALTPSASLIMAYRKALLRFHLEKLAKAPETATELYKVVSRANITRYCNGVAIPAGKTRSKIEERFNIDIDEVPSECIYSYVPVKQAYRFNSMKTALFFGKEKFSITEVETNKFMVMQAVKSGFVTAAEKAKLHFVECGDFMRAEPAPKVYIYYAKP